MTSSDKVLGIDVSHWQGRMNWEKAAAAGVRFAYIKATEGVNYTDPELPVNYIGSALAGIPRGLYHFFRDGFTGVAQAKYFLGVVGGKFGELPIALDVEVPCSAREVWAFVEHIYNVTGRWCLIYTSPHAWNNLVKDTWPFSSKKKIAEHCDLWQAQYPYAQYDDGKRIVPLTPLQPFTQLGRKVWIHQYSCKNQLGAAYGAEGSKSIDLNLADAAWLSQFPLAYTQPEPEPEPESEPQPQTEPEPVPDPLPSPKQVRTQGSLNLRNSPWGKVTGVVYGGTELSVEEEREQNGLWYRTGSFWYAGWLTK